MLSDGTLRCRDDNNNDYVIGYYLSPIGERNPLYYLD